MNFLTDKKKRIIPIVLIIVILLIIIISVVDSIIEPDEKVEAKITVANEISRLDEGVIFSAENSTGDIESYSWDFGDGNSSNEKSPYHSYECTGWYEVTLTVEGSSGQRDEDNITIGIQQSDYQISELIGQIIVISGTSGCYESYPLGPNIGNPNVDLHLSLEGIVGRIEISIILNIEDESTTVDSELYMGIGDNIVYTCSIELDDYVEGLCGENSEIVVYLICISRGGWQGGELSGSIVYPIDIEKNNL